MISRTLSAAILDHSKKMPVIAVTGPRQSGKTTLVKSVFPDYTYLNLEYPDVRTRALEDPRLFLQSESPGLILDEVQRAPELFSYIQGIVDEQQTPGHFILTGSQNFLLLENISQSLAGRVSLFTLLPLSLDEINSQYPLADNSLATILKGGYPRLYDKELQPNELYPSYIQTYIERDVRQIVNVKNIHLFQTFIRLCAGRIGQIFNASSLANEIGVDYKTIQSWMSILQASYIIFLLQPYHKNFNKRLVKSPKIYFYDTGLACSLLGIRSEEDLQVHFLKGELFESLVISELFKQKFHNNLPTNFYYWRDNSGHEIDCIIEDGPRLKAVEIKSGITINSSFFKGLDFWQKLTGAEAGHCFLVYGGTERQTRSKAKVFGWRDLTSMWQAEK